VAGSGQLLTYTHHILHPNVGSPCSIYAGFVVKGQQRAAGGGEVESWSQHQYTSLDEERSPDDLLSQVEL